MPPWFSRLFGKREPPLTGAPKVRRQKTYSSMSGYVYQHLYEGQRQTERDGEPGTQFVFDVSHDRRSSFPVSVFASAAAFESWERARGRSLVAAERYAISKMALLRAFDERDGPVALRNEVRIDADAVASILESLGVD